MPRSPSETIRFLTLDETARLFRVIGPQIGPHRRDRALFLIAYRHGLRASEVGLLRVEGIDLKTLRIMVHRLKGSHSARTRCRPTRRRRSRPCCASGDPSPIRSRAGAAIRSPAGRSTG